jgi:hypothetical protein
VTIERGMGIWLLFPLGGKRDERRVSELSGKNINRLSHGVHDLLVQGRPSSP